MADSLYLKRDDPALLLNLISTTLGTATLLSKDNERVQVPLAPLLSTSKLIRTMVAESNLHPAIYGPLILSCEVSTEALVSVRDILGTGETRISNDDIEEVKQVLSMLCVDADLSQDGTIMNISNINEFFEHLSVRDKGNCVSRIDEDFDTSVKQEIVERVYDNENVDQQGCDMMEKETDMNHNRRISVHEHDTGNGKEKEIMVKREIDQNNCEIGDNEHDSSYSMKNCKVHIQKLSKFRAKTNHTDKTNGKEKLLKCRVCQYSASKPSVVKNHMRSHTGEKPYTCAVCSSTFRRKHHLVVHMRRHTGEKPYTCAICASSFIQKTSLAVHMRSHTDEKPFTCAICSSAFSRKHHLVAHMRRHTGEKPYTCALCVSAFSHKASLVKHMKNHTCENPNKCKEFQ